jgi:hypothetical protein
MEEREATFWRRHLNLGKTFFGKTFTLFGKTIMPILRQSLYL